MPQLDPHYDRSRRNGGAATQHSYRAGEHFDADKAITLMYATLDELYGGET